MYLQLIAKSAPGERQRATGQRFVHSSAILDRARRHSALCVRTRRSFGTFRCCYVGTCASCVPLSYGGTCGSFWDLLLHKSVLWAAPARTRAGGTRRVRNREASACEWPSGGIIDKRFSGGRVRFVVRLVSDGAHISLGSSAF